MRYFSDPDAVYVVQENRQIVLYLLSMALLDATCLWT